MLLKSNKQYFNCKSRIFPFAFSIYYRKPDGKYHNFRRKFNHINSNLYHYAGNNPVKYTDPDGNEILAVTSKQYQNDEANINLNIGSEQTGFYDKQNNYITNTVGRFGCLFVCAVNVGNSYNRANSENYKEQSVASLANNDSYFNFYLSGKVLCTDFGSEPKEISTLLSDMTGKKFNVERVSHKNLTKMCMEIIANQDNKSSYIS